MCYVYVSVCVCICVMLMCMPVCIFRLNYLHLDNSRSFSKENQLHFDPQFSSGVVNLLGTTAINWVLSPIFFYFPQTFAGVQMRQNAGVGKIIIWSP